MAGLIVLADDELELRGLYAACLRREGYEVWEADEGQRALALVRERRPELLILDVWMPGLNGFEVLDQLRHDRLAVGLKVVMLSNLEDSDTRLEGFAVGIIDYWVKGFPLSELCDRVRDVLAATEVLPDSC
jgi:DNA-binding response OmpR family regulator